MSDLSYPIERLSRKPTWRPGVPVVLADGATWHLPVATAGPIGACGDGWAGLQMTVRGEDAPEVTEAYYWANGLAEERGSEPPYPLADHFRALIGAALLRVNYEVTTAAALVLLRHAFEMRADMEAARLVMVGIRRAFDQDSLRAVEAGLPRSAGDN